MARARWHGGFKEEGELLSKKAQQNDVGAGPRHELLCFFEVEIQKEKDLNMLVLYRCDIAPLV